MLLFFLFLSSLSCSYPNYIFHSDLTGLPQILDPSVYIDYPNRYKLSQFGFGFSTIPVFRESPTMLSGLVIPIDTNYPSSDSHLRLTRPDRLSQSVQTFPVWTRILDLLGPSSFFHTAFRLVRVVVFNSTLFVEYSCFCQSYFM